MSSKPSSLDALKTLVEGEAQRELLNNASHFLLEFGPILSSMKVLVNNINTSILDKHLRQLKYDRAFGADFEDLNVAKFVDSIQNPLSNIFYNSVRRFRNIKTSYDYYVKKVAEDNNVDSFTIQRAIENAQNILTNALQEYEDISSNFVKNISTIYLLVRKEYKRLRNKFVGKNATSEKDSFEDDLFAQLFGMRKPEEQSPQGPAIALIDDNCVLTELLLNLCDILPKEYERTVPILKNKKVTSKTKTIISLDEGEVESTSNILLDFARSKYYQDIFDMKVFMVKIADWVETYYYICMPLWIETENLLREASNSMMIRDFKQANIPNPTSITKKLRKINFHSLIPLKEDVAPRTRIERDYSIVRNKLLLHLKETLSVVKDYDKLEEAEVYALSRTKEAIKLRKELDDVSRTENQKQLEKDIQGDNEFYVGKTGQVGSLEIEREAAPTTKYEDVKGESFIRAKEHVEEIIKVAQHAHLMRMTAPRGDIRSNLLLIGSFGCGKSMLAKAIAGDKKIISINLSVSDLLTAYMHESVRNVKRMYEHAKDLRRGSRYTKPVAIILDEFDRFFSYGEGAHAAYDGKRMEGSLQEMMDGVVSYEGVFIVGMTNVPKAVPGAILRRFKYVDVVGQLNNEERADLFKKFLDKGLPLSTDIDNNDYLTWAKDMTDAPGDVIGKIADEIHFKFISRVVKDNHQKVDFLNKALAKRLKNRDSKKEDFSFVKKQLTALGEITKDDITDALQNTLKQPQVRMQINKSKAVYDDAQNVLNGLSTIDDNMKSMGFAGQISKKSVLWGS